MIYSAATKLIWLLNLLIRLFPQFSPISNWTENTRKLVEGRFICRKCLMDLTRVDAGGLMDTGLMELSGGGRLEPLPNGGEGTNDGEKTSTLPSTAQCTLGKYTLKYNHRLDKVNTAKLPLVPFLFKGYPPFPCPWGLHERKCCGDVFSRKRGFFCRQHWLLYGGKINGDVNRQPTGWIKSDLWNGIVLQYSTNTDSALSGAELSCLFFSFIPSEGWVLTKMSTEHKIRNQ